MWLVALGLMVVFSMFNNSRSRSNILIYLSAEQVGNPTKTKSIGSVITSTAEIQGNKVQYNNTFLSDDNGATWTELEGENITELVSLWVMVQARYVEFSLYSWC